MAPPVKRSRRTWRARALRWAGVVVAVLVVSAAAFSLWVERTCVYEPPPLPQGHPAMGWTAAQEAPQVRRCGPAWLHVDDGIAELYLEGDAVSRGHEIGALCGELLLEQETTMSDQLDHVLPPGIKRRLFRKGVLFAYRDLPQFVAHDDQVTVAAMMDACPELHTAPLETVAPPYHRSLFYQTLYDTGQAMAESGLIEAEIGCTSFAASGDATAGGGLLVARTCDFEAGSVFDRRKVVSFVRPDSGMRFVAVSWSGMVGVLTGVNERGLVLMLHAARTERTRWPHVGRPVPLILADALREDATIEDVAKRLRESPWHAAALVVAAETATGRSAVIETDPDHTVIVPASSGVTTCTNHLRDRIWDEDAVARRMRVAGSSALRLARVQELVEAGRGKLDAARAVSILRDRLGLGGREIGLGNRTAVCGVLAAHAVVWDGSARRLLVSRAPRGLGTFVAYDVGSFFDAASAPQPGTVRAPRETQVAESPAAALVGEIEHARELLRAADVARAAGDLASSLRDAEEAARAMHDTPPALLAMAEALARLGRFEEAHRAATLALARQPVPGSEESRLLVLAGANGGTASTR